MSGLDFQSLKNQLVPIFKIQLKMPLTSQKIQDLDVASSEKMKLIRKSMLSESCNSNRKLMMESLSKFTDDSLKNHFKEVRNLWHSNYALVSIENFIDGAENFMKISKILEDSFNECDPYSSCLLYLFISEGVYVNSLQDVLIWKNLSEETDIKNKSKRLSFHDLKKELNMEFWTKDYDPHIRNAIAHNDFHVFPDKRICFKDMYRSTNDHTCTLSPQNLQLKISFMIDAYFTVYANRSYLRLCSYNPDLLKYIR